MIEIDRISNDGFSCQTWRFKLIHENHRPETILLTLIFFGRSTRRTKRHVFKIENSWNRYDEKHSNISPRQIPLPQDVSREALTQVVIEIKGAS